MAGFMDVLGAAGCLIIFILGCGWLVQELMSLGDDDDD